MSNNITTSIRGKLTLLASVSVSLAIIVSCSLFYAHSARSIREGMSRQANSLATMLAHIGAAAVTFGDEKQANQLLLALQSEPAIRSAAFFSLHDQMIAGYPSNEVARELAAFNACQTLATGCVIIYKPVLLDGESVGALKVRVSPDQLNAATRQLMLTAIAVGLASLIVAIGIALILQRGISQPIATLAHLARQIETEGVSTMRAEGAVNGELGDLYKAFNGMLDQIQSSRKALEEANNTLELHVKERTSELWEEIEERRRAQAELVTARDAAEAASCSKSEFLANMSHEIRTPLNAILGFTDMLKRGWSDNEMDRSEMLNTIHSSGRHLLGLINDILDLSKIESGHMDLERLPESPHNIIAEVVSMMRVPFQEKGLSLDYNWTTEVPDSISTDGARLRQILVNLLSNALKFTERGGVQIVARLERAAVQNKIHIDVIDTGIGIPHQKLDLIFDPFVQADNSVTRRFGGTGLGLAISRKLARALGGDLYVESEIGRGSSFHVAVSAGDLDGVRMLRVPTAGDVIPAKAPTSTESANLFNGVRVLVVDDGSTNRKLIGLVLRRAGAQVDMAENGEEACREAAMHNYNVILMDMQMPIMDGYTATRTLRARGLRIPIIALTAHAMKGDREKCEQAGCSGYLTKPIDTELLIEALKTNLGTTESETSRVVTPVRPIAGPYIRSLLPTDDEEFAEIVDEFVDRLRNQTRLMADAVQRCDVTQLVALGHWLKGAGGTAGFPMFTIPASELGRQAREGQWTSVSRTVEQIQRLVDRIQIGTATATT